MKKYTTTKQQQNTDPQRQKNKVTSRTTSCWDEDHDSWQRNTWRCHHPWCAVRRQELRLTFPHLHLNRNISLVSLTSILEIFYVQVCVENITLYSCNESELIALKPRVWWCAFSLITRLEYETEEHDNPKWHFDIENWLMHQKEEDEEELLQTTRVSMMKDCDDKTDFLHERTSFFVWRKYVKLQLKLERLQFQDWMTKLMLHYEIKSLVKLTKLLKRCWHLTKKYAFTWNQRCLFPRHHLDFLSNI